MHVLICQDKGVPVAGIVVSAMGDSAIYLLGATSDAGLNSKGAYLLQWTMIRWLKENEAFRRTTLEASIQKEIPESITLRGGFPV